MPIEAKFSVEKIQAFSYTALTIADRLTYLYLARIGEKCVNRIRNRSSRKSWNDQTGNLRSSIGYIVTKKGHIITEGGFKPTTAPQGQGADGQDTGKTYAEDLATRFSSKPMAVVVVAGMEYAIYVEAMENKDVLASTYLWAQKEAEKGLPKLKQKIEEEWEKLKKKMKFE